MPKDDTRYGPSRDGGGGNSSRGTGSGGNASRGGGGGNWNQNTNAARNQVAGPRGQGAPPAGTGLTTGKTVYGNTAYGPAGGNATGYATMSRPGANYGMGPSTATYSNYRNLDGSQRFAGNPSVTANNAGAGANQIAARQPAMAPAIKPTGGLLDPAESTSVAYGAWYAPPGYYYGNYSENPTDYSANRGPSENYPNAFGPRSQKTSSRYNSVAFGSSLYGNPVIGTPGLASGLNKYK